MKKLSIILIFLLSACSATTADETRIPDIPVSKHTLDNGLEVLLVEDHRLPRVSVNLWYHVGPANEEPGRTGFAHLFEHMMFQQSKHVPEDSFFRLLEAAGGSAMNGTTNFDRTNYFETVPTNQLETALWLESDRMGYLLDNLTEESFRNQQAVVRNERRQGENAPFGVVEEAVFQNLFPKDHPYYAYVIGSHQDIQSAELEDVRKFFKQYYVPNNASLALVGDINKEHTLELVKKYFGRFRRGPDVPPIDVTTPPITAEKRVVVKDTVELPRIYMAWLTPPLYEPGDAEGDLAANLLGGDKVSRLYKSLVYEKQIAQEAYSYLSSNKLASVFMVVATAAPGHTLEELEKEIDAQLEGLRTTSPDAAELEGAKRSVENSILFSLETTGGFGGVADRINGYNHYVKDPQFLEQDLRRYRQATANGVQEFAAKYLRESARVVVHGVPGDKVLPPEVPPTKPGTGVGESVNVDEPWRNEPPKPGPAVPLVLPVPESFTMPNGLTVILDRREGAATLAASLVFRSGSGNNPQDRPGLASFTLDLLDEGTASRTSMQFAEALKRAGASIEAVPARDYSALVLTSARGNVSEGFELLTDAVLNPAFPADEVERVRKTRLGELLQMKEDPSAVADRVMVLALGGASNPYAHPVVGSEDAVKGFGAEDLRSFWRAHMVPSNAALIVSGDFTQADLRSLVDASFGKWTTPAEIPPPATAAPHVPPRLVLVDQPGAAQTQLRVATLGPPRSTPDHAPLEVMNMILGSMFSSRINMNLREKNGYSYGAYSWVRYLQRGGWIGIAAGVQTDATAPAVREVLNEVQKMGETPPSPDEMMLAKEALIRTLPGEFETTRQTAGMLTEPWVYSLGLDYYARLPTAIEAVTDTQVRDVTAKHLVPANLMIVTVGDRRKIAQGLAGLRLGKMEIRNAEGRLLD